MPKRLCSLLLNKRPNEIRINILVLSRLVYKFTKKLSFYAVTLARLPLSKIVDIAFFVHYESNSNKHRCELSEGIY